MTRLQWMNYKAKLERAWRAGDEDAGKELHDIIVEETGLLYQRPRQSWSPKERHHLKVMKGLFTDGAQDMYTKADWNYITSGNVTALYTRGLFDNATVLEDAFP